MVKCTTDEGKHKWEKWEQCYRDVGNTLAEQASQPTYYRRICKECGHVQRMC